MRRGFALIKYIFVVLLFNFVLNVDATIKCETGKPGDTINCTIKNSGAVGPIKRISTDNGLTFVSCDVCDETQYNIEADKEANFKFKISDDISEAKKLKVSFGGESAKIEVLVDSTDLEDDENDVTFYTVTLVPGNNAPEKTVTCSVNSLNETCNVTLESIDDENFTGWGQKGCTSGATGSIKVNKNVTYYACYKKAPLNEDIPLEELNRNLLLETLVVKNGEEILDLGFSMRIFEYSVIVPTTVTKLEVEGVSALENVNVVVSGNEDLNKDENVIKITLTDENNTKNEYILNIVKSDEASIPLLSSLVVGGYNNLGFDPKKFNYDLNVDSGISSLTVNAVPEKEEYEYEIIGQNNIKDGSQIKVLVKSLENNASTTYIINIKQDTSNLLIYIAIGGIVLLVLIILLIIVVKKGKKANKGGNDASKTNKKVENNKAKQVSNIPEAKTIIPTAPVAPTPVSNPTSQVTNQEKDNIEVLDF